MPTPLPFLARLPKVELHCHLVGTLQPATLAALARKHGLALPRAEDALYRYRGFHDFIEVFRLASRVLVEADDFARVAREYVLSAHASANLRHIELFFNPGYHYPFGVSYATQLKGIRAGLEAARQACGVTWRLIPSIDREHPLDVAERMLDDVLAHRIDEVVGIGLDGPEDRGPPAQFAAVYARAARAGLRRTAHVCEDYAPIPAANYATCRDVLGCERFDHGYRMATDPAMLARAASDGAWFTVCPKPSTRERDAVRAEAIRALSHAGVRISVATDDPMMFGTDLADAWARSSAMLEWDRGAAVAATLASIEATWLDAGEQRQLRRSFAEEIAAMGAGTDDPL